VQELPDLREIVFCCFASSDLLVYRKLLAETDA
jgi:hypothetical protein